MSEHVDDRLDGEIEAVECFIGGLSLLCLLIALAAIGALAWYGITALAALL